MKGHQRVLFRVPNVNLRSHDLEIGPHQREDSAKGARVIGEQIQRGCPLNRANNRIRACTASHFRRLLKIRFNNLIHSRFFVVRKAFGECGWWLNVYLRNPKSTLSISTFLVFCCSQGVRRIFLVRGRISS